MTRVLKMSKKEINETFRKIEADKISKFIVTKEYNKLPEIENKLTWIIADRSSSFIGIKKDHGQLE